MGLGKTVQVLALLERAARRASLATKAAAARPSLVVVPRSLVFNWRQEAARSRPAARARPHGRRPRASAGEHFGDYDLVLTTYGTLRRDARPARTCASTT